MAIDMKDSIKILQKIREALNKKTNTTLQVNGNNKAGISFERFHQNNTISPDEMFGDQLYGHPLIKEMLDVKK